VRRTRAASRGKRLDSQLPDVDIPRLGLALNMAGHDRHGHLSGFSATSQSLRQVGLRRAPLDAGRVRRMARPRSACFLLRVSRLA
jgi:hypothetical protein